MFVVRPLGLSTRRNTSQQFPCLIAKTDSIGCGTRHNKRLIHFLGLAKYFQILMELASRNSPRFSGKLDWTILLGFWSSPWIPYCACGHQLGFLRLGCGLIRTIKIRQIPILRYLKESERNSALKFRNKEKWITRKEIFVCSHLKKALIFRSAIF